MQNYENSLVGPSELSSFIQEISKTSTREGFNLSMKRFDDSFIHRYKSLNPNSSNRFPFGSGEIPLPSPPIPVLSQPYSQLGSFYQGEIRNRPAPERYRNDSPMGYVRTEYVPYPYPYHPPYEYNHSPPVINEPRRNPLRESMELRRVKEEMFNQSWTENHKFSRSSQPFNHFQGSRENFYSKK